jgi:prophage regulatory protein
MKSHNPPRSFPPYDRVVREPERRSITGVPTSTWYELQAKGLAPKPFSLGNRIVGWSFNELIAWVEALKRGGTWQSLGEVAERIIKKVRKS